MGRKRDGEMLSLVFFNLSFYFYIFLKDVYACVTVCELVLLRAVPAEAGKEPVRVPGAGVTEPLAAGAGNLTLVLCKSSICS